MRFIEDEDKAKEVNGFYVEPKIDLPPLPGIRRLSLLEIDNKPRINGRILTTTEAIKRIFTD